VIDQTTGPMPTLAVRNLLFAPELTALGSVWATNGLSNSTNRIQSGESRRVVEQDGCREQYPKHAPKRGRNAR